MPWVYDPQSGGQKISIYDHDSLRKQAEDFSRTRPWHEQCQLILRFKNQFCYVDAQPTSGNQQTSAFIRLRHLGHQTFSLAYYTWANERYQPCFFEDGKSEGTLVQAIKTCEAILS